MAGKKYNEQTVKLIPDQEIVKELLEAQKDNIAAGNSDVSLITDEINRRLKAYKEN